MLPLNTLLGEFLMENQLDKRKLDMPIFKVRILPYLEVLQTFWKQKMITTIPQREGLSKL